MARCSRSVLTIRICGLYAIPGRSMWVHPGEQELIDLVAKKCRDPIPKWYNTIENDPTHANKGLHAIESGLIVCEWETHVR